jgi:glucosamine-6-phosphate deaminase
MTSTAVQQFKVGTLKIEIHPDRESAGEAAAREAAQELTRLSQSADEFGVIFATGASQLRMLDKLTSIPGLPWNKVLGFHLDEYIGMAPDHRASFRHYLRQNLISKVKMKEFFEINGTAPDIDLLCRRYAAKLRQVSPQLCLLGIGENGHLAFNDPGEANFEDPMDVRTVGLDAACREQQAAEGWFDSLEDVPKVAITLTMPALFRVPRLILSVPGPRKAEIIRRIMEEPISTDCPATILRSHPKATLHLDLDSAAKLLGKATAAASS